MMDFNLPLVSVLFITYKRVDLLRMSLEAFRRHTAYSNLEIVIADDGSGPEIQEQIRALPADVYALAQKKSGLGANNNNGIRHCNGKYILMIQDDCECCGPPDYLTNTIQVMEANPDVGIVNYCGAPHPIDRRLAGSDEPCYVTSRVYGGTQKEFFLYSDQPHVVSRAAIEHVGYYVGDILECEENYSRRWGNQTRFATAVFPAYYKRTYVHRGAEQSFRTKRFRYTLDKMLMPVAQFLKEYCKPLYTAGRTSVRTLVRMLEKLRLVR